MLSSGLQWKSVCLYSTSCTKPVLSPPNPQIRLIDVNVGSALELTVHDTFYQRLSVDHLLTCFQWSLCSPSMIGDVVLADSPETSIVYTEEAGRRSAARQSA